MDEFSFAFVEDRWVIVHGIKVEVLFHGVYFGFFYIQFVLLGLLLLLLFSDFVLNIVWWLAFSGMIIGCHASGNADITFGIVFGSGSRRRG